MSDLVDKAVEDINNHFPFSFLNNVDLKNLNCSDSMTFLKSLPSLEIITEVTKFSNLQSAEVDLNMAYQTDCKYYSVEEYQKLNNKKKFNLFHSNVNSLEAKFDNLHQFISSISSKFDILTITETSEKVNQNFRLNTKIEGYELYSTPSNSNKGGTAIYVDSNLNSFEREDLKIQHNDFESTWGDKKIKKARTLSMDVFIDILDTI